MNTSPTVAKKLTAIQWLIVSMAAIGFAFDIYELLMAQFIVRPAIMDLVGAKPGTPEFGTWAGRLFYVPAFAGGIFGLLGGYLTDRLGRRRVLTWSILLYAFSAFGAGFSTSIEMLLVLRSTTFVGVCVEFVAAVAWLAELFSDPRQRENVLGYTQAFSSFGGLMVALAYWWHVALRGRIASHRPPAMGVVSRRHHHGCSCSMARYANVGPDPGHPADFHSPILARVARLGPKAGRRHAAAAPAFSSSSRRDCGKPRSSPRSCLPAARGSIRGYSADSANRARRAGSKSRNRGQAGAEKKKIEQEKAASVGTAQEIGGLIGRVLLAILAVRIVSRRSLLRVFQLPGLIVVPLVFAVAATHSLAALTMGAFLAGLFTVAQFSFWGNYLPRVYPVDLRGTGEGFAANIGGRMVGTSFAWVTNTLAVMAFPKGGSPAANMAYTAAGVALFVYAVGSLACFWLPEPQKEELPGVAPPASLGRPTGLRPAVLLLVKLGRRAQSVEHAPGVDRQLLERAILGRATRQRLAG